MPGPEMNFLLKTKRWRGIFKKIKIKDKLLFFGSNSGIHGMRHIFNKKTVISRWFWLFVVIVSAGSLSLLLGRLESISFTPETQYTSWTTKFPAITVCESFSPQTTQKRLAALYPDLVGSLSFDFKKYFAALLYGEGSCGKTYCVPCGDTVSCTMPWRKIAENVRLKCYELVSNCAYNNINFKCCEKFHVVDSEFGPCYSINTLHGDGQNKDPLITVNSTTGPGKMSFRVLSNAVVSVHNPGELSTNGLDVDLQIPVKMYDKENRIQFLFSLVEIENDPKLVMEDLNVRRCRYLYEIPSETLYNYQIYSYGACRLVQYTKDFFEHCQCIHPIRHMSYEKHFCNYTGLHCLLNYKVAIELRKEENGTQDNCLPSCEETELTKIHISRWTVAEPKQGTLVIIEMASLPTLRFYRRLMYTDLDLVVSVGGLFGLFFSASILSFVEIAYLLFRPRLLQEESA